MILFLRCFTNILINFILMEINNLVFGNFVFLPTNISFFMFFFKQLQQHKNKYYLFKLIFRNEPLYPNQTKLISYYSSIKLNYINNYIYFIANHFFLSFIFPILFQTIHFFQTISLILFRLQSNFTLFYINFIIFSTNLFSITSFVYTVSFISYSFFNYVQFTYPYFTYYQLIYQKMNMKIPYAHHHNEYSPPKIYPNKITNVTLDTDVRLKYANGQANQNHNIFTSPKHYENKASDLANFTISKLSPPPQRKTFAVGQNKYILTPKQGHRETSPTLRNNGQANKFELPKNQFKKQLQSNNENVKINKKREDSVKSGQHQTKKVQNKQIPKTVSNQQQLKKYQIIPACFNQAINNIKIVQQKINMQKVLNKSIRKKSNYLSPNIKRGQSPDSLSLKDDFNDEVRSIQGRKQSQKIYNLPKESNKPTNFIKLQTEIAPSRSLKQQSLMKQTRKQVKQRSPSKDKVIKKKQPKYSYKLSETNIQKCKQPKISTASSGGEAPHLEDFPVKQKAPHKLSYQISQPNDIMQIKGKTSFQKKTETHENLNEVNQNKSSQFIFGKVIGTGKFGQVYQAKHKKTGFLVALKKIYKQKIKQYNLQKQLVEEIRLQAYTSHPNIVNMYGIFSDAHHIYLILEYMEGGTLFDFLSEKQKLPPKQVSLIMKEISLAVKYLHKNQIAHRDIKPENILFSHGVAKLCDFGWSARVIDKRKTYCGTFDYVPPEMLQRKQYDQSVDLWCLGVLMYQLLTGKVPFEHKQRTVLMNRIINVDKQKIQYPDHVCQQAIQVIQHLIRKNPNERTKTQQLLEYKFFKMKFQ